MNPATILKGKVEKGGGLEKGDREEGQDRSWGELTALQSWAAILEAVHFRSSRRVQEREKRRTSINA
jgi:hypothetical protein